jgi:Uma2 family endonuclease
MSDNPTHAIQYQAGEVIEENVSFHDFAERYEGQPVEWHMGKVVAKDNFVSIEDEEEGAIIEENVSYEDFAERYEGLPVEWHMGKVIAKMVNNTKSHQLTLRILQAIFIFYLSFRKIAEYIPEGYKMRLSKTLPARMPDLMIVLNERKERIQEKELNGPADIVIEVISPSTGYIDRGKKFYEYEKGAVPEYWIVDPESEQVDIYHLNEKGKYQRIGTENGIAISKVLKGFRFPAVMLWEEALPDGEILMKLIQEMLKNDA